jgi:hypothetical protein
MLHCLLGKVRNRRRGSLTLSRGGAPSAGSERFDDQSDQSKANFARVLSARQTWKRKNAQ